MRNSSGDFWLFQRMLQYSGLLILHFPWAVLVEMKIDDMNPENQTGTFVHLKNKQL